MIIKFFEKSREHFSSYFLFWNQKKIFFNENSQILDLGGAIPLVDAAVCGRATPIGRVGAVAAGMDPFLTTFGAIGTDVLAVEMREVLVEVEEVDGRGAGPRKQIIRF